MSDPGSAAEALAAARWRSVVDTARDGIVTIDAAGIITSFNRAAQEIFGYQASEVVGRNVSLLMPAPYRTAHDGYIDAYHATGVRKAIGRIRPVHAQHKSGEIFPIELSVAEGTYGEARFFTAVIRDVLAADRRYRHVVDLAAAIILVVTPELRVVEFNRQAERVFGRGREEVIERLIVEFAPEEERATLAASLTNVLSDTRDHAFEGPVDGPRGTTRYVSWRASRMENAAGSITGIIAVGHDVTARRLAESRLREEQAKVVQAEKLSSIGQLAAGVAHEVNNPLAGVKSLFAALRAGRVAERRRQTYYDAIADGLARIEQTVRALLDYARPSSGAVTELDLHDVVSACLRLIRPAQNKKSLKVDVRPQLGEFIVSGDRHSLMQATMNVLLNATYAAPDGSEIVIFAEHVEGRVDIHFDDEGPGIPEEHRKRVCDPFFSTKPEGEGTGLGLAVTESIIARHNGELVISARPEGGTRITFSLPPHEDVPGAG